MGREVTPHIIEMYSMCPRKALYNWKYLAVKDPHKINILRNNIITQIIKRCYIYSSQYGLAPTWKNIIKATDDVVRKIVRVTKDPESIYKDIKDVLSCVNTWYVKIYPFYHEEGIVDVPVLLSLDQEIYYRDYVPLITISKNGTVTLQDFSEDKFSSPQLYNDILAQTRIWGFYTATGTIPKRYVRLSLLPKEIEASTINISYDLISTKTTPVLKQILRGIKDGVFYRSPGHKCGPCGYSDICSF